MPKTYLKVYLDSGGMVKELTVKDGEMSFHLNHEKVDIDTFTKATMDEDAMYDLIGQLLKIDESRKEPEHTEVTMREGILHGYFYGKSSVVVPEGNVVEFDCDDSQLSDMLKCVGGCNWFIPTKEYKLYKEEKY